MRPDPARPRRAAAGGALPAVVAAALSAVLAAALAGCSAEGPDPAGSGRSAGGAVGAATEALPAPASPPSSPPVSPGASAGAAAPAPGSRAAALAATGRPGAPQDVVTGLDVPWTIAVLPDGTALVTERDTARVLRVAADGSARPVRAPGPGGAVPGVDPRGEGGLLGLAVSPTFADDGLVYAFTTTAQDDRVVRMRLSGGGPGAADGGTLTAPEPVLTGIPSAVVHHGGRLAFGPDGMLYVSTGEAGDPPAAQDPASLGGKVLRLAPDGSPAPGNPDPASPVWTSGHRNVQGLGWDGAGRLFSSEFGQDAQDELDLLQPGRDYGWPLVEGSLVGPRGSEGDLARFEPPLVTWSTDDASPSGLVVTGDAVYVAALRGERLWRVPLQEGRLGEPEALLVGELGRLRDVVVGPDGALWVLTSNTFRGSAREGDDRLVRLPLS